MSLIKNLKVHVIYDENLVWTSYWYMYVYIQTIVNDFAVLIHVMNFHIEIRDSLSRLLMCGRPCEEIIEKCICFSRPHPSLKKKTKRKKDHLPSKIILFIEILCFLNSPPLLTQKQNLEPPLQMTINFKPPSFPYFLSSTTLTPPFIQPTSYKWPVP